MLSIQIYNINNLLIIERVIFMIKKLLEELCIDTIKEDEAKYFYNGIGVPRVTEILSSMLHEEYLMQWANRIGLYRKKKYEDERDRAAFIGTNVHECIEKYLKCNNYDIMNIDELSKDKVVINSINNGAKSFILWYDEIIRNNQFEIIAQEQSLSCQWFGGTYDMLCKINGKIYLVDFKTSNHISYKYFLQLAAYRYMIFLNLGINIDGCIILQVDKKQIAFEEYVLDFSIKDHYDFIEQCFTTFLSLIYAYYNKMITINMYNNIF